MCSQNRFRRAQAGLTLIEVLIAMATLLLALSSLFFSFYTQLKVNEFSRDRSRAMNDAARVVERIRQRNRGCATPGIAWPNGFESWQAWLFSTDIGGGGGGSLPPAAGEIISVTGAAGADPLEVTVAVCWQHRGRAIGDNCVSTPPTTPASLTTSVTCR